MHQAVQDGRSYVNLHSLERWASLIGGSMLAWSGMRKGSAGIPRVLAGAAIMRRGITGHCEMYSALGVRTAESDAPLSYEQGVKVRSAITIAAPRHEVFQFWRQLDNLPLFMEHLVSVQMGPGNQSHWIAKGPAGYQVKWSAEIINETENELIGWQSLPGGDVDSAGSVRFSDAPAGRGTEIHVTLQYNPPAGKVGALVAKLFAKDPEHEIESDLRRLKQYIETGEVATTVGQSKGSKRSELPGERQQRDESLVGAMA